MKQTYEMYMRRCLQLAQLGAGNVAPNPMVGAVLVYNNRIIGEGYHQEYGQAHAEVNCINSVIKENHQSIKAATLYVSLEPCAHFGKTPPCADLVINSNIPKVVIGCRDPFFAVDGKGIEKLKKAGIEVVYGILEQECIELNKRFFTFHKQQRPFIILKWAQTHNQVIANADSSPVKISNAFTSRMVHGLRSETAAIMVGTNTALNDNPALDTRLWTGNNPVRLVLDVNLRLPMHLKLFDQTQRTIVFNAIKNEEQGLVLWHKIDSTQPVIPQILKECYQYNIQSVLVEGGARLLQSFIDEAYWDEAVVIENKDLVIDKGIPAPRLSGYRATRQEAYYSDTVTFYKPIN